MIFDLKNSLSECDDALLRAKVWSLERENASVRAKIELNTEVASSIKELLPKIDDLKMNNSQTLKEELPKIIKQTACEDISNIVKTANLEILEQVKKKSRDETRSFAPVVFQSKNLRRGVSPSFKSLTPLGS
ncbi:hypothetical protein AVEN_38709-1 [Araneus ventricosus]|uniref:Uncharacterized protein n=1 Tax=Araneus ventricosus TaxID=182803 RepID=A0A4Y2GVL7_ARAVE|nr:hypothetical protein AVEN_38709-1 [Araneus ventricosus]